MFSAWTRVRPPLPEPRKRSGHLEVTLGIGLVEEVERGAEVVVLGFERRRPAVFLGQTPGPATVRQRQELGRMLLPRRFDLFRILQPIARELRTVSRSE